MPLLNPERKGKTQMQINSISDFRRAMRNGPYAWPGGYPLYFVMADGEALSFRAANENRRSIIEALAHGNAKDWQPVAFEINWEDADLWCAHRSEKIESAYSND
jgi:hypothetical protein